MCRLSTSHCVGAQGEHLQWARDVRLSARYGREAVAAQPFLKHIVEQLGLRSVVGSHVHQLSQSELTRASIGIEVAALTTPGVLLVDDVTTGTCRCNVLVAADGATGRSRTCACMHAPHRWQGPE